MRKIMISMVALILALPIIFAGVVTESRRYANWANILFLIILPLAILIAILFFFMKKLDFDVTKIIDSFRPTRWKIVTSFILWVGYILWAIFSPGPMCKMCGQPAIPCAANYGKWILFQKECHCGCYTLGDAIGNYAGIILLLIIFYAGHSVLSVLFRRQKA